MTSNVAEVDRVFFVENLGKLAEEARHGTRILVSRNQLRLGDEWFPHPDGVALTLSGTLAVNGTRIDPRWLDDQPTLRIRHGEAFVDSPWEVCPSGQVIYAGQVLFRGSWNDLMFHKHGVMISVGEEIFLVVVKPGDIAQA